MTEETKRKLEAEEARHANEVKRLLAEKESGWDKEPDVYPWVSNGFKTIQTNDCFSSESKAKEYAVKIELFLRMSKFIDENNISNTTFFYTIWWVIATRKPYWIGKDEGSISFCEKFGAEILKVWVRGEYE